MQYELPVCLTTTTAQMSLYALSSFQEFHHDEVVISAKIFCLEIALHRIRKKLAFQSELQKPS